MKNKNAKALMIIGIILLVILMIVVVVGVYFYYFYVFGTIRICMPEESQETNLRCTTNSECTTKFADNLKETQKMQQTGPEFFRGPLQEVLDSVVYCEQTCKVKNAYWTYTFSKLINSFIKEAMYLEGPCALNEKEIKIEIHGKQAFQLSKAL